MVKRLVVVGNGPLPRDLTSEVESADIVLRFNEPKASKGMSGTRTDILFVNNSGKPMQRRLRDPAYFRSPIVQSASEVIFPYHPITIRRWMIQPSLLSQIRGRRSDWTMKALMAMGEAGKQVLVMPPSFYEDGCAELGIPRERMREIFPSTGYLGLRHVFRRFPSPDWRVEICGFTHEGWRRHAWGDERGWVEAKMREGLLFPVD